MYLYSCLSVSDAIMAAEIIRFTSNMAQNVYLLYEIICIDFDVHYTDCSLTGNLEIILNIFFYLNLNISLFSEHILCKENILIIEKFEHNGHT